MTKPDKCDLLGAARNFLLLLDRAEQEVLDEAFRVLAREAGESIWAENLEPLQGVLDAFIKTDRRRAYVQAAVLGVDGVTVDTVLKSDECHCTIGSCEECGGPQ